MSRENSETRIIKKETHSEISVYNGELTTVNIVKNVSKLKMAFPSLPSGFYEIFADRLKDLDFCDTRLDEAVNSVIDNCIYPTPTIANFISYDKKIKFYNYPEFLKLNDELNGNANKYYTSVKLKHLENPVWCSNEDIKQYKMLTWTRFKQLNNK